jgi:hypothetical protein
MRGSIGEDCVERYWKRVCWCAWSGVEEDEGALKMDMRSSGGKMWEAEAEAEVEVLVLGRPVVVVVVVVVVVEATF